LKQVETVLSPALLPYYNLDEKTVVIIDILRATTSICYAFHNGISEVVPVTDPESCLAYKNLGYLCAAERNGIQLAGFDMGNSPFSFSEAVVKNKKLAITTTNGTFALHQSKAAKNILIGSFLNLEALVEAIKTLENDVVLLCAGWKNKVNLEDTVFAGAVAFSLEDYGGDCDSTLMAMHLYQNQRHVLPDFISRASHAIRFKNIGNEDDIAFCLQHNICLEVPYFDKVENKIYCNRI
jgi:2-phosphosulfolactate phosphatase